MPAIHCSSPVKELEAIPNSMPVEVFAGLIALFGFFLWDALRHRNEPWFKFLMPVGYVALSGGIVYLGAPLIILVALLMGCGLALTNIWRWRQ
ncbi:hypothetical protein [Streptomyces sp. NPDC051909]|uniref:hypothetical protein n=1 Tax=Streptomyces sp. NPDC051909 TaxID=3154944 RepID=UPI0034222714